MKRFGAICSVVCALAVLCAYGCSEPEELTLPHPATVESTTEARFEGQSVKPQPSAETPNEQPMQTECFTESNADTEAALGRLLTDIKENYHPGTAGCSLNAARHAAQLLDWYAAERPAAETIEACAKAYLVSLDEADASTLLNEQIEGVYDAALALQADTAGILLESAGYEQSTYPWPMADVTTLFSAIYAGFGGTLPTNAQ